MTSAEGPQFRLGRSPRLRRSPFFEATDRAGARSFTVYNHMLLPAEFSGAEAEYEALIGDVAIWDVGCQRQVEIEGPDAGELVQYLVTRDVSKVEAGRARYTFLCNPAGGILNDPVMLRLSASQFWLSLADSDLLLWVSAVAHERGSRAVVREPDVSPIQVQGPRSAGLIGEVFGAEIRDLPYYGLAETELEGVPTEVPYSLTSTTR